VNFRTHTLTQFIKTCFLVGAMYLGLDATQAEERIVKFQNVESASAYVLGLTPGDPEASKRKEALLAYLLRAQNFTNEFLISFEESGSPATESYLRTTAGSYVSTVALGYPGCLAVYTMKDSPFLGVSMNSDPPVPLLEGICVILSVIHSAVDQLKVVKKEDVTTNGGDVSKDLLNEMKLATSTPYEWGTRYSEIPQLYKKITGKEVKCSQSSFKSGEVKSKCQELNRLLAEGYDCNLELGFTALGASGHLVNISSAAPMSGDSCQIVVVDTGKQGNGKGIGVPYDAGYQNWSIKSNSSGISIYNFKGDDQRIWNGFGFNASEFRCCKIVD